MPNTSFLIKFGLSKILFKTVKVRIHRSKDNATNALKAYQQVSKNGVSKSFVYVIKHANF